MRGAGAGYSPPTINLPGHLPRSRKRTTRKRDAAHVPVIWATQVLETLAKTGMTSRAEITDAAMGHRAECVILNQGPHVLSAVRVLDDILRRMQAHHRQVLFQVAETGTRV